MFNAYPNEKVLVLIDGPNLYAIAKAFDTDIDFSKLLQLMKKTGHFIRAQDYTTISEKRDYSSIRPLVDWLDFNGFTMVTKPAKEFSDGNVTRTKGDMRVELTVDALRLSDHVDHVVLFSGDGDYVALVKRLQELGKRVSVVSTIESKPAMCADELRRAADQFIEFKTVVPAIARGRN